MELRENYISHTNNGHLSIAPPLSKYMMAEMTFYRKDMTLCRGSIFFFFKILFILLESKNYRKRVGDRDICHPLDHFLNGLCGQSWTTPRLGAWSYFQVPHMEVEQWGHNPVPLWDGHHRPGISMLLHCKRQNL